jgi:predicted nucleotidyltransferase
VTRDDILRLLSDHRDELARLGVQTLALFGSVAREEMRAESDVDLLVDFRGPATFDRYAELSLLLEDLLGRPIDLVTRRSLHPSLWPSVEKDALYVPGLSPLPG